jgi:hypothetical protein
LRGLESATIGGPRWCACVLVESHVAVRGSWPSRLELSMILVKSSISYTRHTCVHTH